MLPDPDGDAYVIGSTATFELSPSDASLLQEAQSAGEIRASATCCHKGAVK